MDIHTYLSYNNVALIDPTLPFQQSCIEQYNDKGYLSAKQITALRAWVHSPESIQRLAPKKSEVVHNYDMSSNPFEAEPEPIVAKSNRFTEEELSHILDCIEDLGSIEDLCKKLPNRALTTVRSTLNNFGAFTRKGKVIAVDQAKFDAYCAKRGIENYVY